MKYRLLRSTKANGFVLWVIQRKFLLWWEFLDSYMEEEKARHMLARLRAGVPHETREVME